MAHKSHLTMKTLDVDVKKRKMLLDAGARTPGQVQALVGIFTLMKQQQQQGDSEGDGRSVLDPHDGRSTASRGRVGPPWSPKPSRLVNAWSSTRTWTMKVPFPC